MKTKFKFVYFIEASNQAANVKWYCHCDISKVITGTVNYDKECNIHYFKPYANTHYTSFNLLDIYNFVDSLDD